MKIVFVIGFPRSGTTFLQSLLCTQPNVVSLPETHFFTAVTGKFKKSVDESFSVSEFEHCRVKLREMMHFDFSQTAIQKAEVLINNGQLQKGRLFEILLADYFDQKNIHVSETAWVVEKTPDHARRAMEIFEYFPEAKFIAIVRHPVDAMVSFYTKLVKYRRPFYQLARQWKQTYRVIMKLPEDVIQIIKYEDLKENPPGLLDQIGKEIKLDTIPENWRQYGERAGQLILPHETWKDQNSEGLKDGAKEDLNLFYRFILQIYLWPQMQKWNYSIK